MSRRGRWIGASAGVLLALLVGAVAWWLRHPLEALAWSQRRALGSAGFERLELSDSGSGSDRLIYFAAGDGPPLILLHGLGDQAGTWAQVAPTFVGRYRVIVPDLPGHGESEPSTGELAMATIVGGAERLLERMAGDTEVSATLVGNSMGAWVATILAHRHPEQGPGTAGSGYPA